VPDPDVLIAAQLIERLRHCGARLVPDLARSAVHLVRRESWKSCSFANVHDFARERFDHSGRWVRNLARLGRAFQEMPTLADAVVAADGHRALGRAAALEISRVAQPETVDIWVECARHCTLRELKKHIRCVLAAQAQASPFADGVSDQASPLAGGASDQTSHAKRSLACAAPGFVPESVEDLRRVFEAVDPGQPRHAFLQALVAEHASGEGGAMIDVDAGNASRPESGPTPGNPSGAVTAPDPLLLLQRLRRKANRSPSPHLDRTAAHAENPVSLSDHREPSTVDPSRGALLRARWTIQAVQVFLERNDRRPPRASQSGSRRMGNPRRHGPVRQRDHAAERGAVTPRNAEIVRDMRRALHLEHEIMLRVDALLLWIDHRRAWSLLGCADAAEFAARFLDESASTLRKRLGLARALENAPALRRAAESGRVSRERLFRLAGLMQRGKLDDDLLQQWAEHVSRITVKQFDDELRSIARRRHRKPRPLSDAEWRESLRLVPGEARHRILLGGLQVLGSGAVADEFLRLDGPADVIRDLRHSINSTRLQLVVSSQRLEKCPPADAARTFPSIRLAQRCVSRRKPIPDWMCILSLLEEFAEQWDNPRNMPRRPTDSVLARDGWRCTAPGCTAREVEVHHIVYRSQGGSDDPSNLTSLCPFHHRMAVHGGLTTLTGEAPLALHWRIGQGSDVIEFVGERMMAPTPVSVTLNRRIQRATA
jgi:hypothetical protein